MAEDEKKQEVEELEEGAQAPPGQPLAKDDKRDEEYVSVRRETLEQFYKELQGGRRAQSTFDRREKGYQEHVQALQVLAKFNDLPEEEKQGAANLSRFSRTLAESEGRANGLSASDIRYIATLPWTLIPEEARRIAEERGTGGTGQAQADDLHRQLFGEGAGEAKKGSADMRTAETRGQRVAKPGFKTLDAALEASMRMPREEARALLAAWGIHTP